MEAKNLQNQKGFTLVEIAIVLVIIGLLLGGVLKGQELIENSKIKSVTQDFDGVSAAYYAYQDRTGIVAGENDAAALADDGLIDSNGVFWSNLRTEGFITGTPTADESDVGPIHALDGQFVAVPGAAAALFTKNHICATNIENNIARGIDIKLDDGDATTGTIRTSNADATAVPTAGVAYDGLDTASVICKEL